MEAGYKVLCCECGTLIESNPSNTCANCLSKRLDITKDIQKEGVIRWCSTCERFFQPPSNWLVCPAESRQLLALCLKKIKGLNKVRLADASFVWTEPHSRRIKLKLIVQQEASPGAVLQQACFIEFIQQPVQCDDCSRVEAKDFWRAVVQLRQNATTKKSIYFIEQEILKHKLHLKMTNIKEIHGGLDFYYADRQDARKLLDLIMTLVPCRHGYAQELVSHDQHSNVYNYKHTYAIEIVPLCKDDVVALPKKLAQKFGNLDQICVVSKVSSVIHLISPLSGKIAEITSSVYWREPFQSVYIPKDFIEFIVIDVEPISASNLPKGCNLSKKHVLADVWIERADEIGTGNTVHTRSHLGAILHPGDSVRGLDLSHSNITSPILEEMDSNDLPDVLLLKKVYPSGRKHRRRRGRGDDGDTMSVMTDMTYEPTAVIGDEESDEEDYEQEKGKLAELFSSMFIQNTSEETSLPSNPLLLEDSGAVDDMEV